MTEQDLGTYEMLWNCPYCNTEKLLGLTHRHCPVCGAAQDPQLRYFPAEEDKVAVENHVYHGADISCPACQAPQSAKATFCANCGSPLKEGVEVARKVDPNLAPRPAAVPKKKSRTGLWIGLILGGVAVITGVVLVLVLWTKTTTLTVTGHTWTREIKIEEYRTVNQSEWCNMMPSDARRVTRTQEVRSYKQIPDGQDCTTRRVDRGDGTFTEKRECTTRYRKEPVYDDKCHFEVDRWTYSRSATTQGASLAQPPVWPQPQLKQVGQRPQTLGNERMGQRVEHNLVHLVDVENQPHQCDFPQQSWAGIADGSQWSGEVGMITGLLDCGSLKPPGAE
jgi:hypothetical protein